MNICFINRIHMLLDNIYLEKTVTIVLPILAYSLICFCFWLFSPSSLSVAHTSICFLVYIPGFLIDWMPTWHPSLAVSNPSHPYSLWIPDVGTVSLLTSAESSPQSLKAPHHGPRYTVPPPAQNFQHLQISNVTAATSRYAT